jgi:hypothetical protein
MQSEKFLDARVTLIGTGSIESDYQISIGKVFVPSHLICREPFH